MKNLLWLWLIVLPLAAQDESRSIKIESAGPFTITPEGKQVLERDVRIEYPGLFLVTADKVEFDRRANTLRAEGNVKVDYRTARGLVEITARELEYDLNVQGGKLEQVTARFGNSFFFEGRHLEIMDRGERFVIEGGQASACNQPTPHWSLRIQKATVQKEGYAFIRGARFRIRDIPLLYLPYMVVPAMSERRSGLLTPDTGRSERNGAFFTQPVYWAPRGDLDFTIAPTYFEKSGWKLDLETRYKPRFDLEGIFTGAYFQDRVLDELNEGQNLPMEDGKPLESDRFRIKWDHDQSLFGGHLEVRVDAGSDFSVDRDYLRSTEPTRVRDYFYRARWERPTGPNLLVLEVNRQERILARNEEVVGASPMPELRLYQPQRHLGSGFFLRNYLYAGYFDIEDLGLDRRFNGDLMRLGLESELSRGQNLGRYLHTRWGAGYKGAFYKQNDLVKGAEQELLDDEDIRGGAFAFLETVGPRLQKHYRLRGRRLVHYLDAIMVFQLGTQDEDPFLENVVLDELDIRIDEQVRGFRTAWKLNSRFFLEEGGNTRPVLEVELSQDLDVDPDDDFEETVDARFRLLNLGGFHANGIFEYDPDEGAFDTISVFGSTNLGNVQGYGGYVRRRSPTVANRESFIGITQISLPAFRSRLRASLDYDFAQSDFKSQEFSYIYQGQCMALMLSYVNSPFDSRGGVNRDFIQISLSFTNLGDVGTKF